MASTELKQGYQRSLLSAGIPADLASQAAEILARDDIHQPNFGRTKSDQQIIQELVARINKGG